MQIFCTLSVNNKLLNFKKYLILIIISNGIYESSDPFQPTHIYLS